ncbi:MULTISPECIES: ribonuclease HII [unclassified Uliginosibacterium]|uniref:ribonuclease HII n=1 Tax=unclassified Uliginosibacterium TaxID=2621521 RepID=UPI000C7D2EFE|nr:MULTISPECIES: ribonuclease HII [unclassified Uliginosibacterium]MDO6385233.1 ribonuclease HII [Uliginosibacterium sp. 31-12]PLK47722.1 ribonuclease HII [Uliginosibacterium sp. TH139]
MSNLLICGVDEAGRGPLCGSVVAAAVILDPQAPIEGLADSKKLSPGQRDRLALAIKARALSWAVAEASVEEIDRLNILHATMLAMRRAIEGLSRAPGLALIDGNRVPPGLVMTVRAIVKGDALEPAISAASILAKTHRDAQLEELDRVYPQYGFAAHKGYPTPAHLAALSRHGVTPVHRRSFGPVASLLAQGNLFGDGA